MTIYDIAAKFNISISTVSKALNGSTDIAESTRRTICEYAAANGYKTPRAKAIKGRIAVLRNPDSEDAAWFSDIADAFRREAEEANYSVVFLDIGGDFDPELFLKENAYTGLFLLGVHYDSLAVRRLKTINIPAVILGNKISFNPRVSSVKSDDLVAVSNAVDHLVSLGHSLIAFLGSKKDSLIGAERFAGYFFGLSKNALPYRYDLTYFGDSDRQSGGDAAEYFLSYQKYFTAIVCASEESALGFTEYMRRAGKKIPEDISVVCFSGSRMTDERKLTTIAPDLPMLGTQAFAALQAAFKDFAAQHISVPCTLEKPDLSCAEKKKFYSDAD